MRAVWSRLRLTDLTNKRTRMDCPSTIEKGYPISSAMAEGACRHAIERKIQTAAARATGAPAEAT